MPSEHETSSCRPEEKEISSYDEIRRHLMEIYHMQIPVNFCIDNKVELPDSYLIYDDEMGGDLAVRTSALRIQEFTHVEFSYALSSQTCHFSSRILAQKEISRQYALIQIEMPKSISCIEQRRYFRVSPPEGDDARVELDLSCAGEMALSVLNISGGGLSFLVPEQFPLIKEGMTLPLILKLSNDRRLQINSLVVNTSPYLNLTRVGVEFFHMSEPERALLLEYVHQNRHEIRQQTNEPDMYSCEGSKIIIIAESEGSKYNFLREKFDIRIVKNPGPLDELLRLNPDIVILDLENQNMVRFLDVLKKAQSTKFFPILISGSDPKGMDLSSNSILYNPPPFKEHYVSRILEGLLRQYQLSRRIMEKDWEEFRRNQKTIVLIGNYGDMETAYLNRLKRFGYRVVILKGEKDILNRTLESRPDLIIVDERLEESDLISLCKMMSFHKELKRIPRILVAENVKNPAALYEQNIVSDVLLRPFPEQELISKIDSLTAHRQNV